MADRLIVLASRSPRRVDLLRGAGLDPIVDPADIDESPHPGEAPLDYVARVALGKLSAVVPRHGADRTVIAADTTVALDGAVLGQPVDDDDARGMLARLSGRTHEVHTAVAVSTGGRVGQCIVTSRVAFRRLSPARIEWYVETGEPAGKAGSYAVQGLGGALVAHVRGSWSNVVGLPLAETLSLLDL